MSTASFLSTTNTYMHLSSSKYLSPTSFTTSSSLCPLGKHNVTQHVVCKASSSSSSSSSSEELNLSKRSFALSLSSVFLLPLAGRVEAAPLEAEDDLELLEKVKQDRKRRLERQGVINSSVKEKGYLQDVVYKLSEVGQAIENNDLTAASSVLSSNSDWIKKANSAFSKLTESDEEKAEVESFNTSISQLISSVGDKDAELSKLAFVSSAVAFEKWITLTGLDGQLKGL